MYTVKYHARQKGRFSNCHMHNLYSELLLISCNWWKVLLNWKRFSLLSHNMQTSFILCSNLRIDDKKYKWPLNISFFWISISMKKKVYIREYNDVLLFQSSFLGFILWLDKCINYVVQWSQWLVRLREIKKNCR